jgi:hypothetical protein
MFTSIDVAEREQDLYRKMWANKILTLNKIQHHYIEGLKDGENRASSNT